MPVPRSIVARLLLAYAFLSVAAASHADGYSDAVERFQHAGASSTFFDTAYGWAVFPTIGKGAIGVGGARGNGRVFVGGEAVGTTTMTQLSVGFQLGGQTFSQIVFFEDARAFDEFTAGEFEFGASASAVAITAGATAASGTVGTSAAFSGGSMNAVTAGSGYRKGMAVFTIAKAGLMYEVSIVAQKFSYRPIPMERTRAP